MFHENCIKVVYIMLGTACNFSCRHCVQDGFKCTNSLPVSNELAPDVVDYLIHLSKLQIFGNKITVKFWGGEPLVYYDSIVNIVSQLGDKFNYIIVTNGELLSEDMVGFFNNNNIHIALSHDGEQTKSVRKVDILEDDKFLALFKTLDNKSLNAIVTAYNEDYYKLWAYFDSKLPDVHVTSEHLLCNWDMPSDLYDFDYEVYKESVERVVKKAFDDTLAGNISREFLLLGNVRDRILRIVSNARAGKGLPPAPTCGQMRTVLNIDCLGNVYACHNYSNKLGTIHDSYESLVAKFDADINIASTYSDCSSCELYAFCLGGCPFSRPSEGKEKCCKARKIFIQGVLDYISMFSDVNLLSDVDTSEV